MPKLLVPDTQTASAPEFSQFTDRDSGGADSGFVQQQQPQLRKESAGSNRSDPDLGASVRLEKIRETSRTAQRRYRQRQRVRAESALQSVSLLVQHQVRSGNLTLTRLTILQEKLLTAEGKIAELTSQLEQLRCEKVHVRSFMDVAKPLHQNVQRHNPEQNTKRISVGPKGCSSHCH